MSEIFGYGIAHKVSRARLGYSGRKVYDSKSAASGELTKLKRAYEKHYKPHGYADPEEYEVVGLGVIE